MGIKLTEEKIEAINTEMRANYGRDTKIKIGSDFSTTSVYITLRGGNDWFICNIEDLREVKEQLEVMSDIIRDSTGICIK